MGLFRFITRIFFGKEAPKHVVKPVAPFWIVHDNARAKCESERRSEPVAVAVERNEVRAKVQEVLLNAHQIMIEGRGYIVDGDSIYIGNASIRLFGIDAPELEHPFGNSAKWALINLCKGQAISAVLEMNMSYERIVARCYLPDGRDISAEMVKMGLAVDWPKYSGGRYRQFEVPNIRNKLWQCDARQKGQMPPMGQYVPAFLM